MKRISIFILAVLFLTVTFASVILVGCDNRQPDNTGDNSVNDSSTQGGDSSSKGADDNSSSQNEDDSSGQGGDSSSSQGEDDNNVTILFQGDSITDNNRSRTDLTDLGGGYAAMVAKELSALYGDEKDFTFINRANSGWNLIDDWNKGGVDHYEDEFYQYNADITTILIGYNDIIDSYAAGGVPDDEFRSCYSALLAGLKERGTTAICIAPFDILQQNDYTRREFPAKRAIIQELAEEYSFPFIDMKPYMLKAVEDGAYKMELFGDLTHPWAAGCRIICDLVVDQISKLLDENYVAPDDLGVYSRIETTADNDEDLTNIRTFFATSHGKAEYDSEVFYSTDEFGSTQSLKVTHEDPNPVNSNAYSKILFDFSSEGKKDISTGKLTFNIKFDNFIPWLSVRAFSALERSGANISKEYGINTTDTSKCQPLENGWYKVTISLDNWAATDTTGVLSKAVAIIVTMSKGEDNQARARFGVDGKKDSVFWIDNLVFDLVPPGPHATQETLTAGQHIQINAAEERAYSKLTFEYKITSGGHFQLVVLAPGWGAGYGYFKFDADGEFTDYAGVSCVKGEDDYIQVTITFSEVDIIFNDTIPTALKIFFIRGDWSTANGFVDNVRFIA